MGTNPVLVPKSSDIRVHRQAFREADTDAPTNGSRSTKGNRGASGAGCRPGSHPGGRGSSPPSSIAWLSGRRFANRDVSDGPLATEALEWYGRSMPGRASFHGRSILVVLLTALALACLAGASFAAQRIGSDVTLMIHGCGFYGCDAYTDGTVSSAERACEAHRTVLVRAVGGDELYRGRTRPDGTWRVDQVPRGGEYEAVATRKRLPNDRVCTRAISPPVRYFPVP